MNNEFGTCTDAGFDWLTLTQTPRSDAYAAFVECAENYVRGCIDAGIQVVEKSAQGYDGYQAGDVFYGTRHDSAIWRATGKAARNVAQFARANELDARITRADCQVSIEASHGQIRELERVLRRVCEIGNGSAQTAPSKSGIFMAAGTVIGTTLSARSSQIYCRAYRADIRHPAQYRNPTFRFEVEYKSERAAQIWQQYQAANCDSQLAASYVGNEFARRGINHATVTDVAAQPLPALTRCASDEKTVHWLTTVVARTVERLVRAGYGEQLRPVFLDALYPKAELKQPSQSLGTAKQNEFQEMMLNVDSIES